ARSHLHTILSRSWSSDVFSTDLGVCGCATTTASTRATSTVGASLSDARPDRRPPAAAAYRRCTPEGVPLSCARPAVWPAPCRSGPGRFLKEASRPPFFLRAAHGPCRGTREPRPRALVGGRMRRQDAGRHGGRPHRMSLVPVRRAAPWLFAAAATVLLASCGRGGGGPAAEPVPGTPV